MRRSSCSVPFGSLAAPSDNISPMSAIGGIADINTVEITKSGLPLSAISGHSSDKENSAQTGVIDQRNDAQGRAAVWALETIDFVDFLN